MLRGLPSPLREALRRNEPLSRHTTLRIGGPADQFLRVRSEEELSAAVLWACSQQLPYLVLGAGSNVLVADAGFRGLAIANHALGWTMLAEEDEPRATLRVASCVPLSRLARHTIGTGLGGLEWAIGIPGTVGGAVVGNAGAHGQCMADRLVALRVLRGEIGARRVLANEVEFGYRDSMFRCQGLHDTASATILSAELALYRADRHELEETAGRYLALRRRTQPRGHSAGSVFRNPEGDAAGRLVDAAGLKGTTQGGAQISRYHANFIINRGGATAADVLALMATMRRTVWDHFGVEMQSEIVIVGEMGPEIKLLARQTVSRS